MIENALNYAELFEEYWTNGGCYQVKNNSKRTYNNLRKVLSGCKSVANIDEYVCGLKTRKESTRRIIVDFLRFVEEKKECTIDSDLYEKKFYDHAVERQLEMAKFLHTPKTAAEIEACFDVNTETRKKDLQALREGIEVLGSRITLEEKREGRKVYYKSTVHPVFLPLNLTEMYALIKYLPRQIKQEDPNSQMIEDIIERIKAQASDYAWEKIYPDKQKPAYINDYTSDQVLAESRKGVRMYLMKSGKACSFFWNGEEYRGRITADDRIKLTNGDYLDADINEVDFIADSFEYE